MSVESSKTQNTNMKSFLAIVLLILLMAAFFSNFIGMILMWTADYFDGINGTPKKESVTNALLFLCGGSACLVVGLLIVRKIMGYDEVKSSSEPVRTSSHKSFAIFMANLSGVPLMLVAGFGVLGAVMNASSGDDSTAFSIVFPVFWGWIGWNFVKVAKSGKASSGKLQV